LPFFGNTNPSVIPTGVSYDENAKPDRVRGYRVRVRVSGLGVRLGVGRVRVRV